MYPAWSIYFALAMIVTLAACGVDPGYVDARSIEISSDIHAVHWNGQTSENPGETADLWGEPNGAFAWHID
jgi:hypothetical protein